MTIRPRDLLPFAATGLIALASVRLPGPDLDRPLFWLAAGLTVAITAAGLLAAHLQRGAALMLVGRRPLLRSNDTRGLFADGL